MPVGPRSDPENVRDTIASFVHYMPNEKCVMVLLDDTRSSELRAALELHDNVILLPSGDLLPDEGRAHNTRGRLFVKELLALKRVTGDYDWECLLRFDDDALFIGPSPHADALLAFRSHPNVGVLGAYLRRGDGSSKQAAMAQLGRRILRQFVALDALIHPSMTFTLFALVARAKRHRYRLGDMCTGGALFLSRAAYDRCEALWRGREKRWRASFLPDDVLLALYVVAAGLELADFSDVDHVMAVNWRGLPMPLEELVRRRKKLVHPVKDPDDRSHEQRVRAFFRTLREREGQPVLGR
jgi:hypothetical protein